MQKKSNDLPVGYLLALDTRMGEDSMLTKLMGLGALTVLVGCGTKSADSPTPVADSQKQKASAPSGFDNSKIAPPVTLPAGTRLRVRLDHDLDTRRSRAGERFTASLAEPIVVGEQTVVPRGTEFRGHVKLAS